MLRLVIGFAWLPVVECGQPVLFLVFSCSFHEVLFHCLPSFSMGTIRFDIDIEFGPGIQDFSACPQLYGKQSKGTRGVDLVEGGACNVQVLTDLGDREQGGNDSFGGSVTHLRFLRPMSVTAPAADPREQR